MGSDSREQNKEICSMGQIQWASENQFLQENFEPSGCLVVIEKTDGVCSLKNFKQPSKCGNWVNISLAFENMANLQQHLKLPTS